MGLAESGEYEQRCPVLIEFARWRPRAGLASRIFSIALLILFLTESRARSECDEVLRSRP